ncbi:MAG: hypothetical protein ACQESP_08270 [Candidatus Muiribacteriota bacterium]
MNFISKISSFLTYPTLTNFKNLFWTPDKTSQLQLEKETYQFAVDIKLNTIDKDNFEVFFNFIDNVEKETVSSQKLNLKRGKIEEGIKDGKLISFIEAKISERGERLIYSASVHFGEYILFHERMVIRIR